MVPGQRHPHPSARRCDPEGRTVGGRRDGHGVDAMIDERLHARERLAAPLLGDLGGALGVAVDHAHEVAAVGRRVAGA